MRYCYREDAKFWHDTNIASARHHSRVGAFSLQFHWGADAIVYVSISRSRVLTLRRGRESAIFYRDTNFALSRWQSRDLAPRATGRRNEGRYSKYARAISPSGCACAMPINKMDGTTESVAESVFRDVILETGLTLIETQIVLEQRHGIVLR